MTEAAARQLKGASDAAAPFETGGILLGVQAGGAPWITRVVELPTENPQVARYQLPRGATQAAVLEGRLADPRVGYLGDWHSHPGDAPASPIDLRSYLGSLRFAVQRSEVCPVLAVVRLAPGGWKIEISARQAPWSRVHLAPVTLTGEPEAAPQG